MKNIIITLCVFFCALQIQAQHLEVPKLSPACKIEQLVGLTKVTVDYSRPSARGRQIFGGLVPYNEVWRTGANQSTTITFSTDVKLNGVDVKKGAYAIFTIPTTKQWDVILYDAPHGYNPNKLDENKIVNKFKVGQLTSPSFVETLTIDFADIKTSSANILINWADVIIKIPLEVRGDQMAMQNIESLMDGPSADDLYDAADYYFHNGKDLDKALEWARKSGEKFTWDAYWPHYLEARILARKKRYAEAVVAGKKASAFVRKAGYILVADDIDEEIKIWRNK